MTRQRAFWIAYAALAAVALALAWRLFPLAIPLVNLDITMSRAQAVTKARAIAGELKLEAADARSAARFTHDGETQNYVELEGGGKPAFAALVKGELYAPFWWDVRLFKPGEIEEATIRFKPDGAPNGFARRLPESYVRDAATKALDPAAARALAEERASTPWGFDVARYRLLERSQLTRSTGRVDHAFVYERPEKLGAASVRLRLTLAGDELVEIAPYVHVPESFARRYRELRSANDAIAGAASIVTGLVYGLGGCVIGVLWLARNRWLVVRPALAAGLVVGALMAAASLSAAPAAWLDFDTAQSTTTFWLRQAGAALAVVLGGGLAYALVFMAAESLTRRAFPWQPQLWRVWSRDAAPTHGVLGRTLGGYLFVPIELALVAAFYYATNRWLGWWQPSEVLTDPNILSSAVPALMPIALSLQAGFMEECLFRAVPLALGAIVGARLGHRRLGIAIAFVLQALVFGAAHANYPGFPAYSRLVELVVPSMLWAAIFLRYGLLPTILLHVLFDLALFSIPLYLVDAPGSWVQRALVIAAALVPLAIVLWRRAKAGAWRELGPPLNRDWRPSDAAHARHAPSSRVVASRVESAIQRLLPALGLGGLVAWLAFTPMHADVPALAIERPAAETAADAALAARGVKLGPEWRRTSVIRGAKDESQWQQHLFVWREAGPAIYRSLVGATLAPPLWEVRYARFEGDVAERAEEWRVTVGPGGEIRQVRHALPEERPGARLDKEAALKIAEREVKAWFGADPAALKLVAAEEKGQPARTDWTFVYTDPAVDVGNEGEARMLVFVAGDEVVGEGRFVHVPETWLRAERERSSRLLPLKIAAGLAFALAALAALILGVRSWMRHHCDNRALAAVLAVNFCAAVAAIVVMWPALAMRFRTTEPIAQQATFVVLGALLAAAFGALMVALVAGVGAWTARAARRAPLAGALPPWAAGAAAALFVAGVAAIASVFAPARSPLWPSLAMESAEWPWAAAALEGLSTLSSIAIGLFVLHLLDRITAAWTRRAWLALPVVVALIAGLVAVKANEAASAVAGALAAGIVAAGVVYCVLRFDPRTVPGYVVAAALVNAAESAALRGTPAGWVEFAVSAIVSVAVGYAALRYVSRPLGSGTTSQEPAPEPAAPPT